jgi:hypothetical protein
MKRWKVALSLAVIAAIAVPALAGTWQLNPGMRVKYTREEKEEKDRLRLANCANIRDDPEGVRKRNCMFDRVVLDKQWFNGDYWAPRPEEVTLVYVLRNLRVAAIAFGLTFALAMVIPVIARRYWQWLRR